MVKRLKVTFTILLLVFCILLGQLLRISYGKPAQVAASQNSWTVNVASSRGTIYDTNLEPLVNEKHIYSAALGPSEALLSHIYSSTTTEDFAALREQLRKGLPGAVRLTQPVAFIDGLELFWTPTRYDDRLAAPHVIGYLDSGETKGVAGIERDYDELLTRYNGKATATFAVDGSGRLLAGVEPYCQDTTKNSVGGIVLTLDKNIQQIVESVGDESLNKGALLVMRSDSGEVVAMASYPTFQPNSVAESIETDNGALLNRAVSLYDCGSVFKMITTAAALEQGVPVDTAFDCCGFIDVEDVRFHCHNRLGHGKLSMTDAFAQSCNLYYIQLAERIGAQAVYDMAIKFGLAESLSLSASITAPQAVLPDINTLLSSRSATANFSFGQGYLMVSPLHIAKIAAVISNGGIDTTPSLIKGFVDEKLQFSAVQEGRGGKRIISRTTADALQRMMEKVVTDGTGQSASPNSCTAAGKTGTAETGQISGDARVTQSWFVGYIPAENPQFVICALTEDANNASEKSTVLFRKIADKLSEEGII
ncbi:MAG: penicillin-binding protein 2 [Clostridia bacterium]|nr:penicillin-binding protein 2 [Clostridia bacterium]